MFWLAFALIQQWILPNLDQLATKKSQIILLYEVLALAVPNNVVWCVGFIMVFHSWLNFLAEVLMFADREVCKCSNAIFDFESFIETGGIVRIRHTFGRRGIFQSTSGASGTFTSLC